MRYTMYVMLYYRSIVSYHLFHNYCDVSNMYVAMCIYVIGFLKTNQLSHLAYSILMTHPMAILIHYPFTVPLPGLVNWSAFLE